MSEPMFGTGTEDMWNRLPQVYREEDAKQPALGLDVPYTKSRVLDPQMKTTGTSTNVSSYPLTRITTGLPSGFTYGTETNRIGTLSSTLASVWLTPISSADSLKTPVNPSEVVSASVWAWTDQPNMRARLDVLFRNAAGGTIGTGTGPYVTLPQNTWTLVRGVLGATAPALTVFATLQIIVNTVDNSTVVAGGKARYTGTFIVSGSTLPSYFDGDTPDTLGHTYSWTGTAHASTSELAAYSLKPNYPYKKYLSGPGSVLDTVLDMLDGFYVTPHSEGGPASDISDLVDATTTWADAYGSAYKQQWLKWLAMVQGVVLDTSLPLNQQVTALSSGSSYNTGTKKSIADAVRPTLTGSRLVGVYDHAAAWGTKGTDPWYHILIVTKGSETTTDPVAAVMKAGAKPAGVVLHAVTFESTWSTIESENPTWLAWDGKTWQQIEESGFK